MTIEALPRPTVGPEVIFQRRCGSEGNSCSKNKRTDVAGQDQMEEISEFPIEIPWDSPLGLAIRYIKLNEEKN